jgi:hypothetical protein
LSSFEVMKPGLTFFIINIGGWLESVSVDRLKPCLVMGLPTPAHPAKQSQLKKLSCSQLSLVASTRGGALLKAGRVQWRGRKPCEQRCDILPSNVYGMSNIDQSYFSSRFVQYVVFYKAIIFNFLTPLFL